MSLLNKILFEFLRLKTNRAIITAQKYLTKIQKNELYFISLSHDQLRRKTIEFKAKLTKKTKHIAYIISLLKKQAGENKNIDAKESIYKAIDKKKNIL